MGKPTGARAGTQESKDHTASSLPSKWAWLQGGQLVPLDVEISVHLGETPNGKADGALLMEEGISVPVVLEPLDLSESVSVPLTVESALVAGMRQPRNGLT